MNQVAPKQSFRTVRPLPTSADLQNLFDRIEEGAAQREYDRVLPYEALDMIRAAWLGALRLRREDGGSDVTIRELLHIVIKLSSADANVAHILRNHFGVVERFGRNPFNDRSRAWQRAIAGGAIIGLANTELGTSKIGGELGSTVLTRDGDGYRLNGTKYYSTGTLYADYVLVRAADAGGKGLAAVIPTNREPCPPPPQQTTIWIGRFLPREPALAFLRLWPPSGLPSTGPAGPALSPRMQHGA